MLKRLKKFNSKDPERNTTQNNLDEFSNQIITKEILDGILIEDLEITAGTPLIVNHGLGREPQGYIIVDQDNNTVIYESTSDRPELELVLNTDTIVTTTRTYNITNWTAYTPAWTSAGVQPAIVDGTLTGQWREVGDTMEVKIQMKGGAGTTVGTGVYYLSIPSPYVIDTTKYSSSLMAAIGSCGLLNDGIIRHAGIVQIHNTTTIIIQPLSDTQGTTGSNSWGASVPFAFATNDQFACYFSVPITGWTAYTDTTVTTYPVTKLKLWIF